MNKDTLTKTQDMLAGVFHCSGDTITAATLEQFSSNGLTDSNFIAWCDEMNISEEQRQAVHSALCVDLAAHITSSVGLLGRSSDDAVALANVGSFDMAQESFSPLNDRMIALSNLVLLSVGRIVKDDVLGAFTRKSCPDTTLAFHMSSTTVRRFGASIGDAKSTLSVSLNPSQLADVGTKLLPETPAAGIPGFFMNESGNFKALIPAAVSDTIADSESIGHGMSLDSVLVKLDWNDGAAKTATISVNVPKTMSGFAQTLNGDTAVYRFNGTIKRRYTDATGVLLAGVEPVAEIAGVDKLEVSVSPSVSINCIDFDYIPSGTAKVVLYNAGATVTPLAVTATILGYAMDLSLSNASLNRNLVHVDIKAATKTYAIPQATLAFTASSKLSSTEEGAINFDQLKQQSSVMSNARALTTIITYLEDAATMLEEFDGVDGLGGLPSQLASYGYSLPAVERATFAMAAVDSFDDTKRSEALRERFTVAAKLICAKLSSNSLFMEAVPQGATVEWKLFCSGENRMAIFGGADSIDLGNGIKMTPKVFVNQDIDTDKVYFVPVVTGSEDTANVLGFGITADVGSGVYKFQGGTNGAVTNGTAAGERAALIPTSLIGCIVTLTGRDTACFVS